MVHVPLAWPGLAWTALAGPGPARPGPALPCPLDSLIHFSCKSYVCSKIHQVRHRAAEEVRKQSRASTSRVAQRLASPRLASPRLASPRLASCCLAGSSRTPWSKALIGRRVRAQSSSLRPARPDKARQASTRANPAPQDQARPSDTKQNQTRPDKTASDASWLRTNGVNTNGAAAKVMNFDRLGTKVLHGTFGKIKAIRLTGVPKKSVKRHKICSDPISADPSCTFPS